MHERAASEREHIRSEWASELQSQSEMRPTFIAGRWWKSRQQGGPAHCDATGRTTNLRSQDSRRLAAVVCTAWCHAASMHARAGRARTFHCRVRPIQISNLSAQTVMQQGTGCQYGVWMGAAKADEAQRWVRTSAIAPPCVRLEGGARSSAPRQTDGHVPSKLSKCSTMSLCTVVIVKVHALRSYYDSTRTLLVY